MIGPIIDINNNRIKWSINLKIVPKTSALMVWQNICIVNNGRLFLAIVARKKQVSDFVSPLETFLRIGHGS